MFLHGDTFKKNGPISLLIRIQICGIIQLYDSTSYVMVKVVWMLSWWVGWWRHYILGPSDLDYRGFVSVTTDTEELVVCSKMMPPPPIGII